MPINKEAIRILVADLGYQETAQRTGIAYDLLRQWSHRYKWSTPPALQPAQEATVTRVTRSPADAHAQALAHHEGQTRLTLAKYASNAAAAIHKSVHPARYTKHANDIAKTMAIVHRQDEDNPGAQFSLNVLNLNMFNDTDGTTLDE